MKERILGIFKQITRIPHCSGETEALREYLCNFIRKCDYEVKVDEAGNVAAYGNGSKVTLQSHYDMVCIGGAPQIETVIEDGWMRAAGSSLGADNGVGVAMTLALMERGAPIDALFTNDEEIGLIGASNLALAIRTPYLLNLDYEEAGEICIGCAGGEDIFALRRVQILSKKPEYLYRVQSTAPGGHSGVNIAEDIPNAITRVCGYLRRHRGWQIVRLEGGERINAIPRRAEALVGSDVPIEWGEADGIRVEKCDEAVDRVIVEGEKVVASLYGFAHGVRGWNRPLDVPQRSVNLAQVKLDETGCEIALSARAMSDEDLQKIVSQTIAGWEACGFSCRQEGKYPAWKPQITPFAKKVRAIYQEVMDKADFKAIHAGLECAIFAERYPNLAIASIGPTIRDPHSDRERLDLASLDVVAQVVERIVEDLSDL